MADTLFVLNVCMRSSALPCSPNDGRRRDITSCFSVRATVERKLWCHFIFLCVCMCVFCICPATHALNMSLVTLFIRGPDVLVAELCQQSGHNLINEPCEYVSGHLHCAPACVVVCTSHMFHYSDIRSLFLWCELLMLNL